MQEYKNPALTVDTIIEKDEKIILIKRSNEPYKNCWAIPGGFVEYGETTHNAAIRETLEETNLKIRIEKLIGVYSDPERDPRGHTVSIVYSAKPVTGNPRADTDAKDVKFFKISRIKDMKLAFDHEKIIRDYLKTKKK